MEFTKENWENAPEGARLEFNYAEGYWRGIHIVGFARSGAPVIENEGGAVLRTLPNCLRIILPKRKVTVQLWQAGESENLVASIAVESAPKRWTLLGEHTFEIEGE